MVIEGILYATVSVIRDVRNKSMEPLPRQARSGPRQNLHDEDMKKQRLSLAYKSWLAPAKLMSYCQDELATRAGNESSRSMKFCNQNIEKQWRHLLRILGISS